MAANRQTPQSDNDGIRIERLPGVRPGVWLVAAACLVLALGLLLVLRRPSPSADPGAQNAPKTTVPQPQVSGSTAEGRALEPHRARPRAAIVPPAAVAKNEAPAERDPSLKKPAPTVGAGAGESDQQRDAGASPAQGIALFPPPGTSPPLSGIIVPDDFELPPGFVRHHQVTDDGKQLPPILMFHPDYKPLDEHGNPIALPEDRVVPPELAPPGLEVRMLDVPENTVPMIEQPPEGAASRPPDDGDPE